MKDLLLDGSYVYAHAPRLNWSELLYGLEHSFINEKGVSEFACEGLTEKSSQEAISLASLLPQESYLTLDLLRGLATNEPAIETDKAKPWIFLLLSFLFDNKDSYSDPLNIVEQIYSDFDYPEELSPLIRYMPASEGIEGSEDQLFKNWEKVLSDYNSFFSNQNRKPL